MTESLAFTLKISPLILTLATVFGLAVIALYLTRLSNLSEPRKSRAAKILSIVLSLTSLAAALIAAYVWYLSRYLLLGEIIPGFIVARAQAADAAAANVPVPYFMGFMLSAILAVMLVVFLAAVSSSLILRDVPENSSRRTAANDIVKTFGGFFIGILTSFLKQAIGGP